MSFFFEILRLGIQNLALHKLRSVLTSLGIILGVAAVIIMVSIGEGSKQAALREIQSLGATNIIVRSLRPPESNSFGSSERSFVVKYGLTRQDLRRVEHFMSDAKFVVPLKSVGDEISFREKRQVSQAFGTTPDMLPVTKVEIQHGRYLSDQDLRMKAPVAVIGAEVANKFFRLRDPIGSEFRIGDQVFRVIGIMRPVGFAGGRGSALVGRDLNLDVHIPITTAETQFGDQVIRRESGSFSGEEVEVSEIIVQAWTTDVVMTMSERVRSLVRNGHPDLNDVQLIVPWELLENEKRATMVWNFVLIAIAAMSLLIGGIGIMNIMLASVTERTREIGIRRALGATRQHIVAQFLVETGSLSALGGLIGIGLGIGVSVGLEPGVAYLLDQNWMRHLIDTDVRIETQITMWSIVISFLVAAAVGLGFGIYPALVASRQDPIVALRHD